MSDIYKQLQESTARVECMLWIAGMFCDGKIADPLFSFAMEEDPDELRLIFPDLPDWVDDALDIGDDEVFFDWLMNISRRLGYLVQIATPVMDSLGYSWAMYRTQWFYGDTVDDAVHLGLAWVAECRAEEAKQ